MNKKQIAHENMASSVLVVLNEFDTIIAANVPIQDRKTVIENIIAEIDENALIQQETTKGATIEEYETRNAAAKLCEKIILGLKAYYLLQNDTTNLEMVNKPYSDLIYGSRTNSLHLMQLIDVKVSAIPILDLVPFGIITADVTDFKAAIIAFEESFTGSRNITGGMKTATSELARLDKDLMKEIYELDILMGPFKISEYEFWSRYTNARIIVDIGAGATAEQVILLPMGYVPVFENKLKPGYTVTFRNPNPFPVLLALMNTPNEQIEPVYHVTIEPNTSNKLHIPQDFGGKLGNFLMIFNPNQYNKVKVTAILAKGASKSGAPELQGQVKPM